MFDFVFKANARNFKLMERYLDDPVGVSRRSGLTVMVALALVIGGLILLIWLVLSLLVKAETT